jgi:ATP adenylyltransferase
VERLFTPWRYRYVIAKPSEPGCVLCRAVAEADRPESLVVHLSELTVVVMNLYPYNGGHVMLAPRRHVGSLGAATPQELADMMGLARRVEDAFAEVYRPDGINLGMNLGRAAGAGVADHIHLHMVPRWNGDTNFMTVVGEVRVLPEEPAQALKKLKPFFAGLTDVHHKDTKSTKGQEGT